LYSHFGLLPRNWTTLFHQSFTLEEPTGLDELDQIILTVDLGDDLAPGIPPWHSLDDPLSTTISPKWARCADKMPVASVVLAADGGS